MLPLSTSLAQAKDSEGKMSTTPPDPNRPWWHQSAIYVFSGVRICYKDMPGLITLVGLFALPSLGAVIAGSQPGIAAFWIASVLPWITITLGNISMVLAIEAIDAGQPVVPARILPAAVRWFPRYIWTNAITTLLFWGVFTPLQWAINQGANHWSWPWFIPGALLLLPMLFWHVRLVFATYATIVDDHTAIRSVMISMGIAHNRWMMVAAAFVGSVLVEAPIAGPLYLLILRVSNPLVAEGYTWALIMLMRPLLIATLHEVYEDFRPATTVAERGKRTRWVLPWW